MHNKVKNIIVLGVIVLVLSTLTVTAALVTSARNITFSSGKTDKTNVQEALEELYNKANNVGDPTGTPKCIRATSLHTEICSRTNWGCSATGYNNGATIVYGNETISNGVLIPGDAFTCDVNDDGLYDEVTERFYYVSDYYNTSTKSFEGDTAVLIYYNNVSDGMASNSTMYAYDLNNINNEGPVTAVKQLPTLEQWKNVKLKNDNRMILTEVGSSTTLSGSLQIFDYSGYAARLLTVQELNNACRIVIGKRKLGELDYCIFLLENTKYSSDNIISRGYWLESPYEQKTNLVWDVYSLYRNVGEDMAYGVASTNNSVRPVIEIKKTDIKY
ncbi:MAG: hypothetical protein ACI31M_01790 [Bacilli bacterium]